jgi:hypothetical protein
MAEMTYVTQGEPTQRPTMRRVFQMFEGIDLLAIRTPEGVQQQVVELKPVHRQILLPLGSKVEKCYLDTSWVRNVGFIWIVSRKVCKVGSDEGGDR